VYHNTICAVERGIVIATPAPQGCVVTGNVVFANTPLSLHKSITNAAENITGPVDASVDHLTQPQLIVGEIDMSPKPGRCEGAALDLAPFASETAFDLDFNSVAKTNRRHRGAYAAPGGWRLQRGIKP
jgi:hypothetical protein